MTSAGDFKVGLPSRSASVATPDSRRKQ
jgi:hypothetical protein